jgi:hypothetical protein
VSPVELRAGSKSTELNSYLQWRSLPSKADLVLSTGAVYYYFPNDPRAVPYNYLEFNATLAWRERVSVGATYAPEVTLFTVNRSFLPRQQAWSAEIVGTQPIGSLLNANVGVGHRWIAGLAASGYTYGSASLSHGRGPFSAELTYFWLRHNTDRSYVLAPAASPLALSLSWHF